MLKQETRQGLVVPNTLLHSLQQSQQLSNHSSNLSIASCNTSHSLTLCQASWLGQLWSKLLLEMCHQSHVLIILQLMHHVALLHKQHQGPQATKKTISALACRHQVTPDSTWSPCLPAPQMLQCRTSLTVSMNAGRLELLLALNTAELLSRLQAHPRVSKTWQHPMCTIHRDSSPIRRRRFSKVVFRTAKQRTVLTHFRISSQLSRVQSSVLIKVLSM